MCFFKKPIVSTDTIKPTGTTKITGIKIKYIIQQKYPTAEIYLSDKDYILPSWDDVALFLAEDQTDKYTYEDEYFDCDDFSYRLMGQFSVPGWSSLTMGIIWTTYHAFNCFIGEDEELHFIEPQTDKIYDALDEGTQIRFIVM